MALEVGDVGREVHGGRKLFGVKFQMVQEKVHDFFEKVVKTDIKTRILMDVIEIINIIF